MPAVSEKQRRFMGAELGRKRHGQKTRTGMSEEQLRDFAKKGGKKMKTAHRKHNYGNKGAHGKPQSYGAGHDHAASPRGPSKSRTQAAQHHGHGKPRRHVGKGSHNEAGRGKRTVVGAMPMNGTARMIGGKSRRGGKHGGHRMSTAHKKH